MTHTSPAELPPALPGLSPALGGTRGLLLAAAGAAAIGLMLLAYLWDRTINHDTAWYLISTRRWLEGAQLYVDLYDVNPPLASYLTVPAILAADAFGIGDANGQYVVIAAMTAVSLFWSWQVLTDRMDLTPPRRALALAGLAAVLIVPALPDVGQREHQMLLLVCPWLLAQIPGPSESRTTRALRAAVAAAGLCQKPYFLALPLCVTLWQALRSRSLRPLVTVETMSMLAIGLAYVGATRLFHPEYLAEVVPLAGEVYLSFGNSALRLGARLIITILPFLPFLAALAVRGREARLSGVVLAGLLAGLLSYLAQGKGLHYHILPFETFLLLGCLLVLLGAGKPTLVAAAASLSGAAAIGVSIDRGTYEFTIRPELTAALAATPQPKSLFAATTGVEIGALLAFDLGAEWASRYPQNWPVPGALAGLAATDCKAEPDRCARLSAILNRVRDDNIADIETFRPEVILIDKRKAFIETDGFSWYDFYAGNPRWAEILGGYRLTSSSPRFDAWTRTGG